MLGLPHQGGLGTGQRRASVRERNVVAGRTLGGLVGNHHELDADFTARIVEAESSGLCERDWPAGGHIPRLQWQPVGEQFELGWCEGGLVDDGHLARMALVSPDSSAGRATIAG